MKKVFLLICACVLLMLHDAAYAQQEQANPQIAQVTTEKGLLNIRKQASGSSGILGRLSNGTLVTVLERGDEFCKISFDDKEGYAVTSFLTFVDVPPEALAYRLLKKDDSGDEVLALKQRLLELGYYRESGTMTNLYNDTCAQRVKIFQRVHGLQEDGVATQMLQYLLFSANARTNTEALPQPRRASGFIIGGNTSGDTDWEQFVIDHPGICTCCMGAGCECCNYTGWLK